MSTRAATVTVSVWPALPHLIPLGPSAWMVASQMSCGTRLEKLEQMLLPFVIGIALSAGVAFFARQVGLDRDRAFYPTVTIVIASYYVLFAAMGGSVQTVIIESLVMMLFAAAAVAGSKSSAWIVVVALAGLVSRVRRRRRGLARLAPATRPHHE